MNHDTITYVLYNRYYWAYKIGITTNLKNRLYALNVLNPLTEIVCVINMDIENFLHRNYIRKRVNICADKEWFDLSDEDIDWLKTLSRLDKDKKPILINEANKMWEKGWNDITYRRINLINNI